MNPLLSIIIVNYRSAPLVIEAIQSVYRYNTSLEFEIIVVDNDSGDQSREQVTARFPGIIWLEMGENAGFARANNAGMRISKGNVFLLLNPDTVCMDDSITQCYHQLVQSGFVAAGVQLLDVSGQKQISGSFFVKGGLNHLLPIPYWGNFIRWLGYQFQSQVPGVQDAKAIEEVDWISGAFLMVKKEVVESAGMMDEDFFLYAEEVEWCSRLRKQGKLCIYGDLKIIHLEGGSINTQQGIEEKGYYNLFDKKGLQLMVSNHLRVRKQYGAAWFLFLLLNYTWGIPVFFIGSTFHNIIRLKDPFKDWNKVSRFASNVWKLWLLSPRIISGKPFFYKMF